MNTKNNLQERTERKLTTPFVKRSGILIEEVTWNVYRKTPIWVNEITDGLFPVKFEYKAKGYKGLVFSERLNKIVF